MTSTGFSRGLLCLFAFALNISISATLVLALLLLIEWGIRVARNKTGARWSASPLDVPVLVLFLWTVLTAAVSGSTTVGDAIGGQSALLLFYWAAHALDESDIGLLFRWFCIGAAAAGLMGIIQQFDGINYLPTEQIYRVPDHLKNLPQWVIRNFALRNERAVGPRNHPLTYSETFIPSFFLLLGWIVRQLRSERRSPRAIALTAFALASVTGGVVFATGRAVWLGLIVGSMAFSWKMGRKFFFGVFAAGLIVAAPVVAFGPAGIRGRLLSIVSTKSGTEGDQQSKATRYTLWTQSLEQIKDRPVFGVGFRGVRLTSVDPISGELRVWTETHNMYLQHALELGVVGLGIFIWMLVVCGKLINELPFVWRPAFCGLFTAFLIAGLTETWTRDKEIAMIFWTFMGCASVLRRREKA